MQRRNDRFSLSRPGATFRFFFVLSLALVALIVVALCWRLRAPLLLAYLIAINLVMMLAYFYDKQAAIRNYLRVPENVLHVLAAAGGTPAAVVSQAAFRHKTIKSSFRMWFWSIFVVQVALLAAWLYFARPWA